MSPAHQSRDFSPHRSASENGYEIIDDEYLAEDKWDFDWQSRYKQPPPPTAVRAAIMTAKETWRNSSMSSIKSGLYTAGSYAAREAAKGAVFAASHASVAATKLAVAGSDYIGQKMSPDTVTPRSASDGGEEDALPPFRPPLNAFNYESEVQRSAARHAAEQELTDYRTKTPTAPRPEETTGPRLDEAEVYFDPLGVSDEWHCPRAKSEQAKALRERMWEEWRQKPERQSRRPQQRPQIWVANRKVEPKSQAVRTDHGLKEIFQSEEESAEGQESPEDNLVFALKQGSEDSLLLGKPPSPAQIPPHGRQPRRS